MMSMAIRDKGEWIQPAILVVLVFIMMALEALLWKEPDYMSALQEVAVPSQGQWLGAYRLEFSGFSLMRYEFSVAGERWIYLFPEQPVDDLITLYIQSGDSGGVTLSQQAQSLGPLLEQGRRIILLETQLVTPIMLIGVTRERQTLFYTLLQPQ